VKADTPRPAAAAAAAIAWALPLPLPLLLLLEASALGVKTLAYAVAPTAPSPSSSMPQAPHSLPPYRGCTPGKESTLQRVSTGASRASSSTTSTGRKRDGDGLLEFSSEVGARVVGKTAQEGKKSRCPVLSNTAAAAEVPALLPVPPPRGSQWQSSPPPRDSENAPAHPASSVSLPKAAAAAPPAPLAPAPGTAGGMKCSADTARQAGLRSPPHVAGAAAASRAVGPGGKGDRPPCAHAAPK
jgi:hypothetical protein